MAEATVAKVNGDEVAERIKLSGSRFANKHRLYRGRNLWVVYWYAVNDGYGRKNWCKPCALAGISEFEQRFQSGQALDPFDFWLPIDFFSDEQDRVVIERPGDVRYGDDWVISPRLVNFAVG